MKLQLLTSPDAIDLQRHGVIQAHAGTGKTYTIENLVLRIISQPQKGVRIHLREILLVTYTEKAAGELKTRIRKGIEEALCHKDNQGNGSLCAHLQDCLATMHEALIGTIHGVCLRLLQTWPFETGLAFATQTTDDTQGLRSTLRQVLRQDWQNPQTGMPQILEIMAQQNTGISETDLERVVDMAEKILDSEQAVLDYSHVRGLHCPEWLQQVGSYTPEQLQKELGPTLAEYADIVQNLAINPGLKKGCRNGVKLQERAGEIRAFAEFQTIDHKFVEDLKTWGTKTTIADQVDDPTCAPIQRLEELRNALAQHSHVALVGKQKIILLQDMALCLRDRWLEHKTTHGLLSFQDMLSHTLRAVETSKEFCGALRQRLRYGIIDEFQDTSVLQWRIFSGLFLNDPSQRMRLYIVGDPKQSIYSFQGADVGTYISARQEIVERGGVLYGLVHNFRSTPLLIKSYNTILGSVELEQDWFAMEGMAYPEPGDGGALASAPQRAVVLNHSLTEHPVQVMEFTGKVAQNLYSMAHQTAKVIHSWVGRRVSIPDGKKFEERELTYADFAVVVQAHSKAEPFLQVFEEQGIPVAKHKRDGVFQSPMAADVRAVLGALVADPADFAPRHAALLTHFYNRHPASLLGDESQNAAETAQFHEQLYQWKNLAQGRHWGRLFAAMVGETRLDQRLALLGDGERKLADLRQVLDYCLERLVRDNMDLPALLEHLQMLEDGGKAEGSDADLHALSNEDACVKILTMHGSKGLQFPVVFAVTGSGVPSRRTVQAWISQNRRHVRLDPENKVPEVAMQANQEVRRLLYVALTRPQLALFVPYFSDAKGKTDSLLAPRLRTLLDRGILKSFDKKDFVGSAPVRAFSPHTPVDSAVDSFAKALVRSQEITQELRALHTGARRSAQTSYSEISRRLSHDRASEPAEESGHAPINRKTLASAALPAGAHTGNALHKVLELAMGADLQWVSPDVAAAPEWLRSALEWECQGMSERALEIAGQLVVRALDDVWSLAPMGMDQTVRLADLPCAQRRAELEYQLWSAPLWVNGFMDVVFRVPDSQGGAHPWRYFVLDWKSNLLENYQPQTILNSIREEHYDTQARLYCHALHRWLAGMLGEHYNPAAHLGGALYVYLRAYAEGTHCEPWYHRADSEGDAAYVAEKLGQQSVATVRDM